ncbi:hypothetical protein RvY_05168-3 [Ramazzottius varieornatus]|uniref:Uncharacterized protein n=1 Tax=Ramazzottius varieornatus TaxID=947166 RepID=A0A1D1UUQ4_RAMVA|nr:hypothetical protein RvY_05168-3 [Ramazzottius varieornatus]
MSILLSVQTGTSGSAAKCITISQSREKHLVKCQLQESKPCVLSCEDLLIQTDGPSYGRCSVVPKDVLLGCSTPLYGSSTSRLLCYELGTMNGRRKTTSNTLLFPLQRKD